MTKELIIIVLIILVIYLCFYSPATKSNLVSRSTPEKLRKTQESATQTEKFRIPETEVIISDLAKDCIKFRDLVTCYSLENSENKCLVRGAVLPCDLSLNFWREWRWNRTEKWVFSCPSGSVFGKWGYDIDSDYKLEKIKHCGSKTPINDEGSRGLDEVKEDNPPLIIY